MPFSNVLTGQKLRLNARMWSLLMRSYIQVSCGLLIAAAVLVLAGCANDDNPGPVQARDLGTQKGEVLVPYEPVVSRKITQDPSGFPMPAAPAPAEAPASAPTEAPATAPTEAPAGQPAPAATPSEAPAPAAPTPAAPATGGNGSRSSGMGELPPTAPAPIGLGN